MAEAVLSQSTELELVYNSDFSKRNHRQKFLLPMEGFNELLETARTREVSIESMCTVPLLKFKQEQYLFRQYNCLKYVANISLKHGKEEELVRFRTQIKEVFDVLFMCNVRLGVSRAKGCPPELFMSRFSDVSESLAKAINLFDYSRGFKFSTYGTWAIMKNLAQSVPKEQEHYNRVAYFAPHELPHEPLCICDLDENLVTQERETLVDELLSHLGERERIIIQGYVLADEKETLDKLGRQLKITKERVRQIKIRALDKLRAITTVHYPHLAGAI